MNLFVQRLPSLLLVCALHIALGWVMLVDLAVVKSQPTIEAMIGGFDPVDLGRSAEGPSVLLQAPVLASLPTRFDEPNLHTVVSPDDVASGLLVKTSAPRLDPASVVDMHRYAQRAGLTPGEEANVVLRVQVLADGRAGQVVVDVSSGRYRVDRGAIAYARAHRWIPGRIEGEPRVLWVRWGVHLQV